MWINSLIAGAGGQIVDQDGDVKVDGSAGRPPRSQQAGQVEGGAARHGHQQGGPGPARLRVRTLRLPGQLLVHLPKRGRGQRRASRRTSAGRATRAPWRASPAARRSEGSTSAWRLPRTGPGFAAARCLASRQTRGRGRAGRAAAHHRVGVRDPKVKKALPFADLLRDRSRGAPRPVNPAYSDISLAIQKTYHPPDARSQRIVSKLRTGWRRRPRGRSSDVLPGGRGGTAAAPSGKKVTDRARSERKLA